MASNVLTINAPKKLRLKGLALPNEHGAWGFLFEPLVAGLAVAFSPAAIWVALLVIGAFLTRQPLRIYIADRQAGRNLPQTAAAFKYMVAFSAAAAIGLIGTLFFVAPAALVPFALVIPFGFYQIYCDVSRQSRQLLPELTGAVAISSSVAVIALAGGWSFAAAFALWAIFIARLIPSILYVRNRLTLEKGKGYSPFAVAAANIAALAAVALLAANDLAPKLTALMFVVLTARAILGISPYRRKIKAMKIGVYEVIYGTLTVLSVIVGHYLQF
jgi:hypothetical protein